MFSSITITACVLLSSICVEIKCNNSNEDISGSSHFNTMEAKKCSCNLDKEKSQTKKIMTALTSKNFQRSLRDAVEIKRSWEGSPSFQTLEETLEEDRKLYEDDKLFNIRRNSVKKFTDPSTWTEFIVSAFWDIVCGREGENVLELRKSGLYNSFYDFVEHINYFEMVKNVMEERGERVYVFGYNDSSVHDVDKIHPVMLVAYAEKFDDGKNTLLWQKCVENHIDINFHHQGNPLWKQESICCETLKAVAIEEMICDKVARRLQKNLNGIIDESLWDVEHKFFDGLPTFWLTKVFQILHQLKQFTQ